MLRHRNQHLGNLPEFDAGYILGYDDAPQAFEDSTRCGLQNLGITCYANALLNSHTKLPSAGRGCRSINICHKQMRLMTLTVCSAH